MDSKRKIKLKLNLISKKLPTYGLLSNYNNDFLKKQCPLCNNSIEDIEHLIFECEFFENLRFNYDIKKGNSINELLTNINFIDILWNKRNKAVHEK